MEHDRCSLRPGKTYLPLRLGLTVANQTSFWNLWLEIAHLVFTVCLSLFVGLFQYRTAGQSRLWRLTAGSQQTILLSMAQIASFGFTKVVKCQRHDLFASAVLEAPCHAHIPLFEITPWPFSGWDICLAACFTPKPGSRRDLGRNSHHFFSLACIWSWIATAWTLFAHFPCVNPTS